MSRSKTTEKRQAITIRFAGDSGDGMQLTGERFSDVSALMGNDIATFPDYPAEIRAPAGTLPGVSSFQIQFSESIIFTPGDIADALIAMNPAALKVNLKNLKKDGLIIVNDEVFDELNLKKAAWKEDPLKSEALKDFQLIKVPLTTLTKTTLKEMSLTIKEVERCKNFFALGIMFWIYGRETDTTAAWIAEKFSGRPDIAKANEMALMAGYSYADATEAFSVVYNVPKAPIDSGTYRKISGNEALAIGMVTASRLAEKTLFYGSYPITPASTILHELAKYQNYDVKTFQAEDEISACGAALGASYGGHIGATGTSGPGLCLKSEMIGLGVMVELPLIIVNVQRGGPSTGMPTKTEQSDLLQSLFGRNGESPIAILAPKTPADCFQMALEAVRIAIEYMTPVILLSDGYIANGSEPWKLPDIDTLKPICVKEFNASRGQFLPYQRDPNTLARPWVSPGTPGLEHRIGGLSKADLTGNVSYDPENNEKMVRYRAEKINRIRESIPEMDVYGKKDAETLVLGWGGTFGAIYQAVSETASAGLPVAGAHLRYLNPFPKNFESIIKKYSTILIPELNSGQLLRYVYMQYPQANLIGLNKIQGQPFKVSEISNKIKEVTT